MNQITCPHCKKSFEPGEAIVHELKEKIVQEQEQKHRLEIEKAKKEAQLAAEKVQKEKSQKELEENKKEKEKLQIQMEKMIKQQEESEKKRKEEEEKFKEETIKKAEEEQRLKLKEKDLMLEQARKANDELKRKLEQGSQQMQGEVLELDFEDQLRKVFAEDQFLPVPKGVEGGDIWQKVMYKGSSVGSILWEVKRTKAWSKGWPVKLKNDAARISASQSVIVSNILPEDIKNFSRIEGVWITAYEHAISVCRYVRLLITTVASLKSSTTKTEEEWGKIRDYMLSDSFIHRMQGHYDVIKSLKDLLDADRRSTQIRWKKQEAEINKLDTNTSNFYGELKAIVKELPELDGINSPLLSSINDESAD